MKNKRSLFFVVIASVIVLADLFLLQSNIFALWWHVRHGFHRDVNGVRFQVPLFYEESENSVSNQFCIHSFRTPVHGRSSFITVEFPPWASTQPSELLSKEAANMMGLTPLRKQNARFGRRTGNCAEYLQNKLVVNGPYAPSGLDPVYIRCQFGGDLTTTFDGTRNAAPEFYAFMESAQEVKQ